MKWIALLVAPMLGCTRPSEPPKIAAPIDELALSRLADAPAESATAQLPGRTFESYAVALEQWKTIEDVNEWIRAHFKYDSDRALALSETQRSSGAHVPIHEPAAFFSEPTGVCLDLARFGFETVRHVDAGANPHYLMIEFEPIEVRGAVLRRHWLVTFERSGKLYAFADSKRPGHIAGPYDAVEQLVADYERFRARKIVSARQTDTLMKKHQRMQARP